MRRMLREVLFVRDERADRCLLVLCLFIFSSALLITAFGGPQNSQNQSKQFQSKQFQSKQFQSKQFQSKQFQSKQFQSKQLIAFFSSKSKQLLTCGFLTFFL
jgi:hypothetical protein